MGYFSVWMDDAFALPHARGRRGPQKAENTCTCRSFPLASGAPFQECQEFPPLTRKAVVTLRRKKKRQPGCRTPETRRNRVWRFLALEEAADVGENFGVHDGSDASGLRVLLAGVVNAEQTWRSRGDFGFGSMCEFVLRARSNHAALL